MLVIPACSSSAVPVMTTISFKGTGRSRELSPNCSPAAFLLARSNPILHRSKFRPRRRTHPPLPLTLLMPMESVYENDSGSILRDGYLLRCARMLRFSRLRKARNQRQSWLAPRPCHQPIVLVFSVAPYPESHTVTLSCLR